MNKSLSCKVIAGLIISEHCIDSLMIIKSDCIIEKFREFLQTSYLILVASII